MQRGILWIPPDVSPEIGLAAPCPATHQMQAGFGGTRLTVVWRIAHSCVDAAIGLGKSVRIKTSLIGGDQCAPALAIRLPVPMATHRQTACKSVHVCRRGVRLFALEQRVVKTEIGIEIVRICRDDLPIE